VRTLLTDLDQTRATPLVLRSGTTLRGGQVRLGRTFYIHPCLPRAAHFVGMMANGQP